MNNNLEFHFVLSCYSMDIETFVLGPEAKQLYVYLCVPNFSKSVNETSSEASLAPGSCTYNGVHICTCLHIEYGA